jgi:hypothetical protein
MAIDGTWKIKVSTPMGEQESTLNLKTSGAVLEGSQTGPSGTMPIQNGKVDGNRISWSGEITQPFPMKLDFNLTVAGDQLSGSVKAGDFGNMPITGSRVG